MYFFNILKYNNFLKPIYCVNIRFLKQCLHHKCSQRSSQNPVYTNKIGSIFKYWENCFKRNKILEPKESIEHILAFILGSTKVSDVYKNMNLALNEEQVTNINQMCSLRMKRMPIQYIIREWDFRDLTLKMRPPVFIPRPETEMLIDIILDDVKEREKLDVLEICCGSGAISLALLKSKPQACVTAVDQSIEACELTTENSILHQVQQRLTVINTSITEENRLQQLPNNFDIIVSNPPYVPTADMKILEPEITLYEDLKALDGGPDGLDLIKTILLMAAEKLKPNGKLYLETDISHPEMLKKWTQDNKDLQLDFVKTYKDFCKKDRFVKIIKL